MNGAEWVCSNQIVRRSGADTFIGKFDVSGELQWIQQFGSSSLDESIDVATDGQENVYVSGYTSGSLKGENAGLEDAFFCKYDMGGRLLWTHQFGTSGPDRIHGVSADRLGNVFVTSYT